jgi:hypothetical protein
VEIYFLSNENEYRSPSVQLDLATPSIRKEYLKHRPGGTRFLDYPSMNSDFRWAFDTSKEADEVVIPGRIPAHRVIGRCTLTDLKTKCDMSWLFDGILSDRKYKDILSQLPIYNRPFLQKMAVSAKKLISLCEIREKKIASLSDEILFNALIAGLNKSRNVCLWNRAKEVWEPGSESVGVEDFERIFSSMRLGSN